MKQLFFLLLAASTATAAMADQYATPGNGSSFTFADIAAATESVTANGNIFTVLADFTVSEGDTLKLLNGQQISLADKVEIDVDGTLDFQPTTSAIVTRANAEAAPKGFRVTGDNAVLMLRNTTFQYMAFNYMSYNPVVAENCTFSYANTSLTSTAAFAFLRTTVGNEFINCRFLQNESSAIGGGATTGMGMRIEGCYFYDNNTSNSNKPQLNLIGGGEDSIVIRNCTFVGTGRTMVGGIGFMNYYVPGSNQYIIENNVIQGHRYGIGAYSYSYPLHFIVRNNVIINNNAETNANNGGSGLSFYDYGTGMMNVYAEGNRIEGNLWGVTVLGNVGEINFGKTADPNAEDYNPGNNVFVNNGNGGVLYDFFNNTSNNATIYAQGNLWNVEQQDSLSIAELVWDSHDQGGHGEVIFAQPTLTSTAISQLRAEAREIAIVNGKLSVEGVAQVYSTNGVLVLSGRNDIDIALLPTGTYLVRNGKKGYKFCK